MIKNCLNCKDVFRVPQCRFLAKYCSRKCADSGKRVSKEHKKLVKQAYLDKNREKNNEKTRCWRLANKDKRRVIQQKWREKNKELTNSYTRNYIYRRKKARGTLTLQDTKTVYQSFQICPYCNINKPDTIDHVIPLSKGGTNDLSNVVAVCRSCNSKKRDKTLLEYNPLLFVMWDRLTN